MAVKETTLLFPITDTDLRTEYEELGLVEEFKELTPNEMKFVWFYANQTSPYIRMAYGERVLKCLEILKDELSGTQMEEFVKLSFPPGIAAAIEVMGKFNPKLRTEAKSITETIFKNIKKIVSIEPEDIPDMEEKKKYIAISMDVIRSMPELINQMEQGYGIRTKGKKKEVAGKPKTLWDSIMDEES